MKSRKGLSKVLFFLLLVGLLVTTAYTPPSVAQVKPIELKFATHSPPAGAQYKDVFVPWAEEVKKRTEGRVTVNIFPAELLGKVTQMYDMVLKGVCDVGYLISTFYPGRHPLEEVFHLPFLIPPGSANPKGKLIRDAVYKSYLIPHHYKDVKVLWTGRFEPNVLHLAKKPVRTIGDMKGLVVGFPGGKLMPRFITAVGGSPEQVTVVDMYTAMERGMIAGQIVPLEVQTGFKLSEVTKYITMLNLGSGSNFIGMRFETWNKLSPADQKIIDELSIWAADLQGKALKASTDQTTAMCIKRGIEFIELSPEERARWIEAAKPVEEEWVKQVEAKGLPAREMCNMVKQMAN
jgi:TRAP-type C4-dicarboxylate transport system substrate-binding protein